MARVNTTFDIVYFHWTSPHVTIFWQQDIRILFMLKSGSSNWQLSYRAKAWRVVGWWLGTVGECERSPCAEYQTTKGLRMYFFLDGARTQSSLV